MEKQQLGRFSSASVSALPLENGEKSANDHKLSRLKNDAENKKNAIKNLKEALNKLESSTTLDIDSRIRQAELEYALGREELQLLSIVEEARAVQLRIEKEKSKTDVTSLCAMMLNGHQLALHAVQASTGRWNASQKHDYGEGFFVDWVMEGEDLQRGDRILEINGKIIAGRSKDELQRVCANTVKCDLVVIRKKSTVSTVNVITSPSYFQQNQQQLQQSQADNMRLQHRISYLEEQVKELLETQKEKSSPAMSNGSHRSGTHITSISISSSPSDHDEDRPLVYQRGSYITTIVDGKPQKTPPKLNDSSKNSSSVHKSSSTTNVNTHHQKETPKESSRTGTPKSVKSLSSSMSRISINTDLHVQKQKRDRERKEREKYYNNKNILKNMSHK
jgi:sulfur dioxygenase